MSEQTQQIKKQIWESPPLSKKEKKKKKERKKERKKSAKGIRHSLKSPAPSPPPPNVCFLGSHLTFLGSFISAGLHPGCGRPHSLVGNLNKTASCLYLLALDSRFQDGIVQPGAQVMEGSEVSRFSRRRRASGAVVMRLRVHVQRIAPPALEALTGC